MQKCNVCCEKYTAKKKKKVQCKFCGYEQCLQCVKTFFLQISETKCMNCNVRWDQEYIQDILPKTFIYKEYKEYQQKLLIEDEKKYYPQYIQIIQDKKEAKLINTEINQIKKNILNKKKDYQRQPYTYTSSPYNVLCPRKECDKQFIYIPKYMNAKCSNCKADVCKHCLGMKEKEHRCKYITEEEKKIIRKYLAEQREKLKEQMRKKQGGKKERQNKEIQYYYIACPKNECKGYIQAKKNNEQEIKCVICDIDVCKKCNKQKFHNNIHECKKEDVASTQQIIKECKQCPKCHINIYKIEGCNDMFCTMCKVSFDWRTGKEQRPAHNPHYYDYIRHNNVRQQNYGYRCENRVDATSISQKLRRQKRDPDIIDEIMTQSRYINHLQEIDISILQNGLQQSNQDISIQYLQNQIGIKQYQQTLFQRKKRREKYIEYIQILDTYINLGQEIIHTIYGKQKTQSIDQEYQQIRNLFNYIKENINRAKKKYDSVYKISFFD